MSFSERFQEIRTGFERPFWIANITEIFERLSYYGAFASLALYLQEKLNFSTEQTGTLTGFFGGMVWFLAIFGGAAADRLGFRRALSMAYLILAAAYFLIGSIGASWLAPVRNAVPLGLFVGCHSHPSRARHLAGEALRSRHHGPRFQGERPLHRLLDLLHDGQHRRRCGALFRFLGASPSGRRECVPRGRAQRLRHVLCGPVLLPGTAQARGCAPALDRDRRAQLLRGGGQLPAGLARADDRHSAAHRSGALFFQRALVDLGRAACARARRHQPVHVVSRALHRLLGRLLAAVHQLARLHSRVHQLQRRRRDDSGDRRADRDLPYRRGESADAQDTGASSHHPGHA